jgi:hypothetical protein
MVPIQTSEGAGIEAAATDDRCSNHQRLNNSAREWETRARGLGQGGLGGAGRNGGTSVQCEESVLAQASVHDGEGRRTT